MFLTALPSLFASPAMAHCEHERRRLDALERQFDHVSIISDAKLQQR